ncbi:MAG: hypothetical protein C4539_04705 [Ignavibacteriales bacterium]|nr:MAG: hypothetical protein C4539_04705 [Ignavibacteriales bacterium]
MKLKILLLAVLFANTSFAVTLNKKASPDSTENKTLTAESLPPEFDKWSVCQKVDWLMEHMTLSEKIDQLNYNRQVNISDDDKKNNRFNIPRFVALDGPRGIHDTTTEVCYPVPLSIAASWDTALAYKVGKAFGKTLIHHKTNQLLAPALNIIKHPLAGRNAEYLGEDPFLSGKIAAAEIKGIQSEGCIATPKHFACNSFETGRFRVNENVGERVLREIYLPAFQLAVEEGKSKSLMTAYNSVNNNFMSANAHILNILFNEWSFSGYIISDWDAYMENSSAALTAGSNVEYPGSTFFTNNNIEEAIKEGMLSESLLDVRVRHILERKFDPQLYNPDKNNYKDVYNVDEQRKLAADVSSNSIVLLKNSGSLLPLKESQTVALIGPFADSDLLIGNQGSSTVFPERKISVRKSLEEQPGNNVAYAEGCKALFDENLKLLSEFPCKAEYFANLNCEGEPVIIRNENSIRKSSFKETGSAEQADGISNKALKFDGNSYLKIGTFNGYEKDQDFALSFWVKLDEKNDKVAPIFSSYIWGVLNLDFTSSGFNIYMIEKQASKKIEAVLPVNEWTNIILMRRNGSLELYYDGEKKGEVEFAFPISGGPLYLGGNPDADKNASCTIDEISLYSKALSEDEIKKIVTGNNFAYDKIFYESCNSIQEIMSGNEKEEVKIDNKNLSVRWTGDFIPNKTGKYYFVISSNSGVRFFIDEKIIFDQWQEAWIEGKNRQCWIEMEEGRKYKLQIEYSSIFDNQRTLSGFIKFGYAEPDENQLKMIEDAVSIAKQQDVAIVVAGVPQIPLQGEANDNETYNLPGYQDELIKAVAKANPNTVVVLCSAGGVEMGKWINQISSLLEVFYPGQEGGLPISDVLFGKINPGGKLPVTYPVTTDQLEVNVVQPDFETTVCGFGYRLFDKKNNEPQFPFGFGLSYTTFSFSNLSIKKEDKYNIEVSFTVTNTGKTAGAEVAQLYVGQQSCSEERPVRELKGFSKVFLNPGESTSVTMYLNEKSFSFYSEEKKKWIIVSGEFNIEIGNSSRDIKLRKAIRL